MSNVKFVTERILNGLGNNPVHHQSLLINTIEDSSFGSVRVIMFIMPVANNDFNAEMYERRILQEMEAQHIYVAFHKTRRQEGERLITVAKALEPNHFNYTPGNLKGFTKLWLIKATDAERAVAEIRRKRAAETQRNGRESITIGRR
jgi:hypothetical protein